MRSNGWRTVIELRLSATDFESGSSLSNAGGVSPSFCRNTRNRAPTPFPRRRT
jgi:hypothetical protein